MLRKYYSISSSTPSDTWKDFLKIPKKSLCDTWSNIEPFLLPIIAAYVSLGQGLYRRLQTVALVQMKLKVSFYCLHCWETACWKPLLFSLYLSLAAKLK